MKNATEDLQNKKNAMLQMNDLKMINSWQLKIYSFIVALTALNPPISQSKHLYHEKSYQEAWMVQPEQLQTTA